MKKVKNSNFKSNLLVTTALTTSLMGYYRRAEAGSCSVGDPGETYCSGAAGTDTTETLTSDVTTITTLSGFGMNVASGDAINVNATGAISFTDLADNSITTTGSSSNALSIVSSDGGAITINLYGDLTSEGDAIITSGGNTQITVNSGSVIDVDHAGNGDGYGIEAYTNTTGADVTVIVDGSVTGGQVYTGSENDGIYIANSLSADDLIVSVSSTGYVKGEVDAIDIKNDGVGYSSVSISGTLVADKDNGVDIANSAGASHAYINASSTSNITSYNSDLKIDNSGESYAKIVANGTINSSNSRAVAVTNLNSTNATNAIITSSADSNITSDDTAILIKNYGSGYSSISVYGTVNSTSNGDAIRIDTDASATNAIVITGNAADIDTTGDSSSHGIEMNNYGSGYSAVTAGGNINAAVGAGDAIKVYNGSSTTNATVTTNANSVIIGDDDGIDLRNYGSGTTTMTTNGSVTGRNDDAIYAYNDSSATSITVTVNADSTLSAGDDGVDVRANGTGDLTVTSNGTISAADDGINTDHDGSGASIINVNNNITTTSSDGVDINNDTTATTIDITIASNVTIDAEDEGIEIDSQGSGAATVTVNGSTITSNTGAAAIYNYRSTNGTDVTIQNGATISGVKAITTNTSYSAQLDVTLDGSSSAVSLTGSGGTAMDFGSTDDSLTISGDVTINGDVTAGAGTDSLTLSSASLTLGSGDEISGFESATISGTNTVSGSLNLGGVDVTTSASSSLKVNNGTLTVSNLYLSSGSTLSGTSTIVGDVTAQSGSTIAPGNSIGTQTITGTLAFASGSTFDVEIDGNSADRIDVTGSITIDSGATLNVTPTGNALSGSATILTSTAGISGTFGTATSSDGSNLTLIYTDDLNLSFVTADTSIFASQIQSSVNNSILFNDTLTTQIADNAFSKGRNFWMRGIYRDQNSLTSNSNRYGASSTTKGFAFGAQKDLNDSYKIGFSLSQINDNLGVKGSQGTRNGESTLASIYGIYNKELCKNIKTFTSLSLGLGYHDGKNKRLVTNSGVQSYANAITNDTDISLTVQTGVKIKNLFKNKKYNDLYLMPLVSASYIHTLAGGFDETNGGNSQISVDDYNFATVKFRESFRFGTDQGLKIPTSGVANLDKVINKLSNVTFSPYIELGLAQERAIGNRTIKGTFFNGTAFSTNLNKDDRNFVTASIGTRAQITKDITGFLSYERSTSNQENRNDIRAGISFGF